MLAATVAGVLRSKHVDVLALQEVSFKDSSPDQQTQLFLDTAARALVSPSRKEGSSDDERPAKASEGKQRGPELSRDGVHAYHCPTLTPRVDKPIGYHIDGPAILTCDDARAARTDGAAAALEIRNGGLLHMTDVYSSQRLVITVPDWPEGANRVLLVNTHLESELGEEGSAARVQQVMDISAWVKKSLDGGEADHAVLCGDFNAPPEGAAYAALKSLGFISSHASVHGNEPAFTFPTGLKADSMDTDPPLTTDYVWLLTPERVSRESGCILSAASVELLGMQHVAGDATMYPSDHFGVLADLVLVPISEHDSDTGSEKSEPRGGSGGCAEQTIQSGMASSAASTTTNSASEATEPE